MNGKELKIKSQIIKRMVNDEELFEVTCSPDLASGGETRNNYNYENVIGLISKTNPDIIVIAPEEINSVTLVQYIHDLNMNYYTNAIEVQRGGEFVEKYISYELIFHHKLSI